MAKTPTWQHVCLFFFKIRPFSAHHLETAFRLATSTAPPGKAPWVSLALHPHALASRNWEYKALGQRGNRHLPILGGDVDRWEDIHPRSLTAKTP